MSGVETNPEILAARAKLAAKFESRIGGKGTQRRKVKASANKGGNASDDKKTGLQFKKMGLHPIPGIEEVNMFTENNEVIHFKDPKVMASLQSNTYGIQGASETKSLQEMLPKVIHQLGTENLMNLAKIMGDQQAAAGGGKDMPSLDGVNFEETSKQDDVEVD